MRAQEFVREGGASFLAKVFKAGEPAVAKAATEVGPHIENRVVPAVLGRPKPEDVTHAYRNMNSAELQHAQQTGYFTAKDPTRDNRKWWTADTADPQGMGGLNSEPYPKSIVRVPIDKVPSGTAVNANHAEFWNRETGEWAPVITPPVIAP